VWRGKSSPLLIELFEQRALQCVNQKNSFGGTPYQYQLGCRFAAKYVSFPVSLPFQYISTFLVGIQPCTCQLFKLIQIARLLTYSFWVHAWSRALALSPAYILAVFRVWCSPLALHVLVYFVFTDILSCIPEAVRSSHGWSSWEEICGSTRYVHLINVQFYFSCPLVRAGSSLHKFRYLLYRLVVAE
jgi:hypothetical protein